MASPVVDFNFFCPFFVVLLPHFPSFPTPIHPESPNSCPVQKKNPKPKKTPPKNLKRKEKSDGEGRKISNLWECREGFGFSQAWSSKFYFYRERGGGEGIKSVQKQEINGNATSFRSCYYYLLLESYLFLGG